MALIEAIKDAFGIGSTVHTRTYECQECGNEFVSAKDAENAQCMECLSRDVEVIDGTD